MTRLDVGAPEFSPSKRVPAEDGFWVLIFGDLAVFTAFFGTFLFYRGRQPELFATAQRQLSTGFGLANTLLLLTGSLFVCIGMRAVRGRDPIVARRAFGVGLLCAMAFVGVKTVEWGIKFHDGISPATNNFYMYYFILTGLHLFHVLIGVGALCFLTVQGGRPAPSARRVAYLEGAACFWHMVDMLWIILFPLVYLVR